MPISKVTPKNRKSPRKSSVKTRKSHQKARKSPNVNVARRSPKLDVRRSFTSSPRRNFTPNFLRKPTTISKEDQELMDFIKLHKLY